MLKNGLLPEGCSKLKSRQQRKPCHRWWLKQFVKWPVQWTTRNEVAAACRHQRLAAVVWIGSRVLNHGGSGRWVPPTWM